MLNIAMDALVTRFCRSPTVTVTNLLHQDRAEPAATPKRKIVYPQIQYRSSNHIWQIHDVTQDRLASGLYP